MKKIVIPIQTNNLDSQREKAFKTILDSHFFDEIIDSKSISEQEIKDNASIFLEVLESNLKCQDCTNISQCSQSQKGIVNVIDFDTNGNITLGYSLCKHQQTLKDINKYFEFHDFEIENLNYPLQELASNDFAISRTKVIDYIKKLINQNTKKGLYLYGSRRSGKTFIVSLLTYKYSLKFSKKIAFINSASRINELKDLYFISKIEFDQILNKYIDVDVLVLDDFGNEYKNSIVRDTIILPLLNGRLRNNKLTIFTSNYSLDDIKTMYALEGHNSVQAEQIKEVISLLVQEIKLDSRRYRE